MEVVILYVCEESWNREMSSLFLCVFFFFSPPQSADLSVFETNIRFVGGLLSAYALTGDQVLAIGIKGNVLHVTWECILVYCWRMTTPNCKCKINSIHLYSYYIFDYHLKYMMYTRNLVKKTKKYRIIGIYLLLPTRYSFHH